MTQAPLQTSVSSQSTRPQAQYAATQADRLTDHGPSQPTACEATAVHVRRPGLPGSPNLALVAPRILPRQTITLVPSPARWLASGQELPHRWARGWAPLPYWLRRQSFACLVLFTRRKPGCLRRV